MNQPAHSQPNIFSQAYFFCRTYWPVFIALIAINAAVGAGFKFLVEQEGLPKLAMNLAMLMSIMWAFWIQLAIVFAVHLLSSGGDAHLKHIFDESLQRIAEFFFLQLAFYGLIILGLQFFIIPGVIVAYKSIFVSYAFVVEKQGIMDSFRTSFKMTPIHPYIIKPFAAAVLSGVFIFFLLVQSMGIEPDAEPVKTGLFEDLMVSTLTTMIAIYFTALFYRSFTLIKLEMAEVNLTGSFDQDDEEHSFDENDSRNSSEGDGQNDSPDGSQTDGAGDGDPSEPKASSPESSPSDRKD